MTDKPILFSGPMVRALLAGTKTQTRRVIKPQPTVNIAGLLVWKTPRLMSQTDPAGLAMDMRIAVGDRLYVRETFTLTQHGTPVYRADARDQRGDRWPSIQQGDPENEVLWKPSIHMPRWASRITLTVTDVRVQRLQDISPGDSMAEGIQSTDYWRPKELDGRPFAEKWWDDATFWAEYPPKVYRLLWEAINGPGSWDANPWVAAYSFTVAPRNIDQMER